MSAITDAYRHTLPSMLQSISPRLAALHASRDRLLAECSASTSNLTSTDACLSCGAMLHPNSTPRATRKATRRTRSKPQGSSGLALSRMKAVTETCYICGQVRCHETSRKALKEMPSVRRMKTRIVDTKMEEDSPSPAFQLATPLAPARVLSSATSNPIPPSSSTPTNPIPLPPAEPQSSWPNNEPAGKPRPKKRVGLQEMLARNRSQKDRAAAEGKRTTGLADFLVEL